VVRLTRVLSDAVLKSHIFSFVLFPTICTLFSDICQVGHITFPPMPLKLRPYGAL